MFLVIILNNKLTSSTNQLTQTFNNVFVTILNGHINLFQDQSKSLSNNNYPFNYI